MSGRSFASSRSGVSDDKMDASSSEARALMVEDTLSEMRALREDIQLQRRAVPPTCCSRIRWCFLGAISSLLMLALLMVAIGRGDEVMDVGEDIYHTSGNFINKTFHDGGDIINKTIYDLRHKNHSSSATNAPVPAPATTTSAEKKGHLKGQTKPKHPAGKDKAGGSKPAAKANAPKQPSKGKAGEGAAAEPLIQEQTEKEKEEAQEEEEESGPGQWMDEEPDNVETSEEEEEGEESTEEEGEEEAPEEIEGPGDEEVEEPETPEGDAEEQPTGEGDLAPDGDETPETEGEDTTPETEGAAPETEGEEAPETEGEEIPETEGEEGEEIPEDGDEETEEGAEEIEGPGDEETEEGEVETPEYIDGPGDEGVECESTPEGCEEPAGEGEEETPEAEGQEGLPEAEGEEGEETPEAEGEEGEETPEGEGGEGEEAPEGDEETEEGDEETEEGEEGAEVPEGGEEGDEATEGGEETPEGEEGGEEAPEEGGSPGHWISEDEAKPEEEAKPEDEANSEGEPNQEGVEVPEPEVEKSGQGDDSEAAAAAGPVNQTSTADDILSKIKNVTADSNATKAADDGEAEDLGQDDNFETDIPEEEKLLVLRPPAEMFMYQRRGKILEPQPKYELSRKKGKWRFVDKNAKGRPSEDYCGEYPNRDIPFDALPPGAWQKDGKYRGEILKEGKELTMRAMEEILAEYGFGAPGKKDDIPFEERRDQSPFTLEIFDPNEESKDGGGRRSLATHMSGGGARMTKQSYDGLVKRLLHAIVTNDSFNLVLGGHSAAAGHGNHFQQSYALQFQKIMEPIFARFGVKHYSRNMGMGGLGTIQSAMGSQDIYGKDIDILIWDSAMTEDGASPEFDLFVRQAILGGDRAPMVWTAVDEVGVYAALQEHAGIDYMFYGTGMDNIPEISNVTDETTIAWAARYLKCDNEFKSLCDDNRYNGTCWIDRPDFTPTTPQKDEPGGRADWHGGNREHQLRGRLMAFTVLRALYSALEMWEKNPVKVLKDGEFHMTEYYDSIKARVAALDPSIGTCYGIKGKLPEDFCKIPFHGRTEFTPRANPEFTSLRSIMKPFGPNNRVLQAGANIYNPPDVKNPYLDVPDGTVDILTLIENGDYVPFLAPSSPLPVPVANSTNKLVRVGNDLDGEKIVPGLGWGVHTFVSPNQCNGTYDSFCGRYNGNDCLLYGHNDFRGGLSFDSLSGWGVFTLRNIKYGKIFVKMDSWRLAKDNMVTDGWTEVNNGTRRALSETTEKENQGNGFLRRDLRKKGKKKKKTDERANFCPDLILEFAVGKEIIQIPHDQILGPRHSLVQRVVQIWTVSDNSTLTQGRTADVELGIRLRGCGRQHVFWLTHIYWA